MHTHDCGTRRHPAGWRTLRRVRWTLPAALALIATTAWAGPVTADAVEDTGRSSRADAAAAAPLPDTTLTSTALDLGTLGGTESTASDVDGDIVVGASRTASGRLHAFAYDLGAATPTLRDLGTLAPGADSYATAVDGHTVVGTSNGRAFAYDLDDPTPSMVDLGTFGGTAGNGCATASTESRADDVSGDLVVGSSLVEGGGISSFVHDLGAASPALVDLGRVAADECFARSLAVDSGLVVGTARVDGDEVGNGRAFAYDTAAVTPTPVDLGTLGGRAYSSAADVDGRVVVGESGHAFAVRLGAPGSTPPPLRDLGVLGDGPESRATAVDGDLVVGTSLRGQDDRAFVYDLGEASPRMRGLGTLGGVDSFARDVDGGLVAGTSRLASAQRDTDPMHAFAYDADATVPAMVDLGTIGGENSTASAVSGPVVVGQAQTAGGDHHATVWTVRETTAPSLRFSPVNVFASEDGPAVLTVTRAGAPGPAVGVRYETTVVTDETGAQSATPGRDFRAVSGTLSFATGQTQRTVRVPLVDDTASEDAERFAVTLTSPSGGAVLGTPRVAGVTIRTSDQRVDALISRRPATAYAGNGIYNRSAARQSRTRWAGRGGSRAFYVEVQNDGTVANVIAVRGSRAWRGSTVRYQRGGRDVTRAMVSARGLRFRIGSGGSRRIAVRVSVGRRAAIGSAKPATVSATWTGDSRRTDVVRGTVRVAR